VTASTRIKTIVNKGLNRAGLELNTLTIQRRENRRLQGLKDSGYFDKPAFPVPKSFADAASEQVFDDITRYAARFDDLSSASSNHVGFSFDNPFFTSPDAEVLYCIVRRYRPRRIVEIGSGNSTRIFRLALCDGNIDAQLTSVDPRPRVDVDDLADRVIRDVVEDIEDLTLFTELDENDVLFIDSSHEIRTGGDITHLYLNIFPLIAPGVIVQIHDIFLPYDYRSDWLLERGMTYTEQYLVQAILQADENLEVIWPGYYLQRTVPDFAVRFPHMRSRDAQSLWLRKSRPA